MKTRLGAALLWLSMTLVPAATRADVPMPDLCNEVGSSCSQGGRVGTCEASTCTRLDYSAPPDDLDGAGPRTVIYPCNRCNFDAAPSFGAGAAVGPLELGLLCCCAASILLLLGGGAALLLRRKKRAET